MHCPPLRPESPGELQTHGLFGFQVSGLSEFLNSLPYLLWLFLLLADKGLDPTFPFYNFQHTEHSEKETLVCQVY